MSLAVALKKITNKGFPYPKTRPFALAVFPFEKAKLTIQFYYYFLLFLAVFFLPAFQSQLYSSINFSPIWSLAWADLVNYETTVYIVGLIFFIGAFAGAFMYWHRFGRILAFLGVFQYHAFSSSFGEVNHQWYLWLFVSFLLIFLPNAWGKRGQSLLNRKKFLLVFWSAQAFILLTYSMAGVGKIYYALMQFLNGEAHAFSVDAMARHIAYWLPRIENVSALGPFIINHPIVGWPFFVAAVYLQFFALWALFTPSIQKIWAFGLISMHIGTYVTISITFIPSVLILLIFFMDSPFRARHTSWQEIISDLPFIGWPIKYLRKHS